MRGIMAAQEIPRAGYRPRLLHRTEVAVGAMAFHFEKPSGFDFKELLVVMVSR
jgi:hypothetical protein